MWEMAHGQKGMPAMEILCHEDIFEKHLQIEG
jgi:hypothetical protein